MSTPASVSATVTSVSPTSATSASSTPVVMSVDPLNVVPPNSEWNVLTYLWATLRWGARGGAETMAAQRALAYASEVGEASRPMVPRWMVRSTYGLSWLYVGADTALQVERQYATTSDSKQAAVRAGDALVFHSVASMAAPAFTIHTIVKQSNRLFNVTSMQRFVPPRVRGLLPTVLGLGSIPFIVHPIDHVTEAVMNRTIRPQYAHLLAPAKHSAQSALKQN